jgi:hypothetical protein
MALILWYLLWGAAVTKHVMAQTGETYNNKAIEENAVNLGGVVNMFSSFSFITKLCCSEIEGAGIFCFIIMLCCM